MAQLRTSVVIGSLFALSLLFALPVTAAPVANGDGVTVTFFHSANAEAGWAHYAPSPPGDPDTWSIRLWLGPSPAGGPYAGAVLHGIGGPPPAVPPSFDFFSTVSGSSGGSPRLHLSFSDTGYMDLRPLTLVQNVWTHEDGASSDWDVGSPTCPFLYQSTYAAGLACHPGATVTSAYVVTDSSWLYAGGYTHYIDNIRYGDVLITSPACGTHGDGEFNGEHHGDFSSETENCRESGED